MLLISQILGIKIAIKIREKSSLSKLVIIPSRTMIKAAKISYIKKIQLVY